MLVSVAAGVGATLGLPTYLSDIINRGIADKDMNYILHTGVIMLGIAILGMVCIAEVLNCLYKAEVEADLFILKEGGMGEDLKCQHFFFFFQAEDGIRDSDM